jgi:hypothetical protein
MFSSQSQQEDKNDHKFFRIRQKYPILVFLKKKLNILFLKNEKKRPLPVFSF